MFLDLADTDVTSSLNKTYIYLKPNLQEADPTHSLLKCGIHYFVLEPRVLTVRSLQNKFTLTYLWPQGGMPRVARNTQSLVAWILPQRSSWIQHPARSGRLPAASPCGPCSTAGSSPCCQSCHRKSPNNILAPWLLRGSGYMAPLGKASFFSPEVAVALQEAVMTVQRVWEGPGPAGNRAALQTWSSPGSLGLEGGSRAALTSLSVDTEAKTQDFTSREEQFKIPECLTPSKLSAWLMHDSKSECLWNVCVTHQKQFL